MTAPRILLMLAAAFFLFPAPARSGDFWHRLNWYGTLDMRPEDVVEDMTEDVYGAGKLRNLYSDPCDLFHLNRGTWACRGCRYAPLHYEELRPAALSHVTPYAGHSWYRGVPVGVRREARLSNPAKPFDHSHSIDSGTAAATPAQRD